MKESNMQNVDERTPEKLPRQNSINLARKKCTGHISKINISQQLNIQFISFYTKESLNSILIIFGLDVFEIAKSDFEIDWRTPGRSFFQPVRYLCDICLRATAWAAWRTDSGRRIQKQGPTATRKPVIREDHPAHLLNP
jgi:hypothetical protein